MSSPPSGIRQDQPDGGRSFFLARNRVKVFCWFLLFGMMPTVSSLSGILFIMPQKPKAPLKPLPFKSSETIGERIARIRKHRGLSQSELAEKIGIEKTLVSDYERGKIRMYDELVIRFALALRVSSDELLGIKNQAQHSPAVSLRLMRRLATIDKFPESTKKHIIRLLDESIAANSNRDSAAASQDST